MTITTPKSSHHFTIFLISRILSEYHTEVHRYLIIYGKYKNNLEEILHVSPKYLDNFHIKRGNNDLNYTISPMIKEYGGCKSYICEIICAVGRFCIYELNYIYSMCIFKNLTHTEIYILCKLKLHK